MKLTTIQTAERLNITDRHVRRLIAEGKLPAEREGKEWLVDEEAITLFEQGVIKNIKDKMDEMAAFTDYIVANPDTIEKIQQKKLPIQSKFISYEEYLDKLFIEKRKKASELIKKLPLLDEKLGSATAMALYNEFRECFVLGVNGAAITLAIVMLDYASKHRLFKEKTKITPDIGWTSVEGLQLGETVKKLKEVGVITEDEEAQLLKFNSKIRNSYMHYKIQELIKDMVILELPSINIQTGEVTIHKNVDVKTMPHLWFSAKKKRDAETVAEISAFCISWVNRLLKKN
jgi:excisionase family DNA binding protein